MFDILRNTLALFGASVLLLSISTWFGWKFVVWAAKQRLARQRLTQVDTQ